MKGCRAQPTDLLHKLEFGGVFETCSKWNEDDLESCARNGDDSSASGELGLEFLKFVEDGKRRKNAQHMARGVA